MPRPVIYVPPDGAVFELTSRTFQERFLLRPGRMLNEILIGVLGRAQRLYGVDLFAAAFLSNHFHLLVRVMTPEQLSGFMQYFKGNLAKEVGRIHDWRGGIWGRRYRPIWVYDDEAAQLERLRYILSQACKEGLVSSPLEWPGVHCAAPLTESRELKGTWYNRTAEFAARRRGEDVHGGRFATAERVVFSPLPCWSHLSPEEVRKSVLRIVHEIEDETKRDHVATGSQPLGVAAILRQHPHQRPTKSESSPAPRFHAVTRASRRSMREAYSLFLAAYYRAVDQLRRGRGPVEFPQGCFPPRLPSLRVPYQLVPG